MTSAEPGAPFAAPPSGRSVAWVLAAGALAGLAMGALRPALHVALEPAQVLAGVVAYPGDNPFHLYQRSLWTVWHQILAPLIAAGISERALTIALSGVVGALSFAALALLARAFGAAPALALATPFLLLLAWPELWGFQYPILLLGHGHTYGMAGLSWGLLALGLLAAGRRRAGAFALGFAPALHASLGAWLGLAAAAAALASRREVGAHWRAYVSGGALGAVLAAASLLLHLQGEGARPQVDASTASRYLTTFVRLWDFHRVSVSLFSWNAIAVFLEALLAIALLRAPSRWLPEPSALALRILVVASLLGLALVGLLAVLPANSFPDALLVAMPTRLLNLPMLALVPLLVGTLWTLRASALARLSLLVLSAGAFATARDPDVVAPGLPLIGLVALGLTGAPRAPAAAIGSRSWNRGLDVALAAVCAAAVLWLVVADSRQLRPRLRGLLDQTNDRVLAKASEGTGLLAVGSGIPLPQLRTRRPVLVDPTALDMLPYALAGGPALARILDGVYGIDFFAPPESALHSAGVPEEPVRALWEARTPAQWQAVAVEFGFTEVLVRAPWRLRLPQLARDRHLALYRVPPGRATAAGSGPSGSQ